MKRRIVVTGLGVACPLGLTVDEYWSRLLACESGISEITSFDHTAFRVHIGGEIKDWDEHLAKYIESREVKKIDRFTQFGLVTSIDAFKDSGLDMSKEDPFRCGVITATGIGGLKEIEEQHLRLLNRGPRKISAFTVPKMMPNACSGQISIMHGMRGMNTTVSTACASATNAIGDAMRAIWFDDAEVMMTGGCEAAMTVMGVSAFAALRALSERNDEPKRASRPFDVNRDGFVLSEGAASLVLEELEHAKARGAKIYGELIGYGATADAGHITQPDENGTGATRAVELALKSAGLNPEDIDYVNSHGTSTPLGDVAETRTLKNVFGDHAKNLSVTSNKSQIGHLLGASGGVEMISVLKTLGEGVVTPTINLEDPDPRCDLDYTPNQPREREIKYALKNSFGFGGHNACLIAARYDGT